MRQWIAVPLLFSTCCLAQSNQRPIPANFLIPKPPPSAPLSDWTGSATRVMQSIPLTDATLRGWEYPSSNPNAPIILFFNGNGMTVDRSDLFYRQLAQTGAELCVYDYRGIGFSAGLPDVMAFRQDALRLYDALTSSRSGRPVIVYGFSLGTAMATYVASQRKVAGLILAGTIASASEELPVYSHAQGLSAETAAALVPAPDAVEAFNEVGNISRSTAPLLMLHGEADTLVPINQGREVFAASSSSQKRFISLPGVAHNQTPATAQSIGAVAQFLAGIHATP
jgi:hypothetical protein